jgi:GNAT superfamily N-acetyltransferase
LGRSGIEIRGMTGDDADFCLDLLRIVGWGNTRGDFERMMHYEPGGCFVAAVDGVDVGMVASIDYGAVGWVGNLIVRPGLRGRGVGALLMEEAIHHLRERGVESVCLDSVPLAIPLYRRLGFKEVQPSLRFTGEGQPLESEHAKRMRPSDLPEVAELDGRIFGASRDRVLKRVFEDFPETCFVARVGGTLTGFIMAKEGEGFHRIGPWICDPDRADVAEDLLRRLMDELAGEKLWAGVLGGNPASAEILGACGFSHVSTSLRMCLGRCESLGDVVGQFGLGGPDKG